MKNILKLFVFAALACVTFASCSEEDLNAESIFENGMGNTVREKNELDKWLDKNFVEDYNISFQYYYNDKESDQAYNVTPADYDKAKALAWIVKYVWLDAYTECLGGDKTFLRTYTPRVIQLSGSLKYNDNGSVVMGTAEGGMKVMLYGINNLDLDNPRYVADDPYASTSATPLDMNYWYFHTMHHEFCHILTQTKEYSTDFQTISNGTYHATDWINLKDKNVAKEGFVTAYASGEYNEDFAETYATYISLTETGWNKIIEQAGEEGAAKLNQKVDLVRKYFQNTWNIDIDQMREIVQRRASAVCAMDIRNLDFTVE